MISVQLSPTRTVEVSFRHPTYTISPHGYTESFERKSTRCYIYEQGGADRKMVSMGVIKQYFKDREWSKEKRRVEALKRALEGSGLTKEEHSLVWVAYHRRPRHSGEEPPTPAAPVVEAVIIPFPIHAVGAHAVINKLVRDAKVGAHGAH